MRNSINLCRRCASQLSRLQRYQAPSRRWVATSSSNPPSSSLQSQVPRPRSSSRHASTQPSFSSSGSPNDGFYVTSLGTSSSDTSRALLQPNNLFHSFTSSPAPEIRRRAAFMRQQAYCPHSSHHRTRVATSPLDPESRKPNLGSESPALPPAHVQYECPDCGVPISCCEQHYMEDYESHLEICDTLRQINEDDHDLRSGRFTPEYEYPGPQRAEEFVLNMSNWDTFLYTRDFKAIDDERAMRQVTRLLTYPITVASVLHELSPYNIKEGGRLTPEGLRSFSGMPHPPTPYPNSSH